MINIISLTSVQKKVLRRDTLLLLSDLLTIVMGHFFPTTGEVGISFHDSCNRSGSYEMSHEANYMYFSCLISVRIDISFSVRTERRSFMLHLMHSWA